MLSGAYIELVRSKDNREGLRRNSFIVTAILALPDPQILLETYEL